MLLLYNFQHFARDICLTTHQKGFTLLELVITIIILGALAVFTFSSWTGSTINLGGQTQQLANDIRYAQSLAMTKGQRYRWIKTSSNTYQIQNSSGTAITLATGSTTVTLNSGISFGALSNLPNSLVNFDGAGVPYTDTGSPGTALSSTASIPLTSGSDTTTVTVTSSTGRVSVQ